MTIARPDLFDLSIAKLSLLYDEVIEVSYYSILGEGCDSRMKCGL